MLNHVFSDRKHSWGKILDQLLLESELVLHVRLDGDSIDHLGSIGFVDDWSSQVLEKIDGEHWNYIIQYESIKDQKCIQTCLETFL